MKQRVPMILALAACILSALCLWQVVQVKKQLTSLSLDLFHLENTVGSLPYQIDEALQTQASLLAGYDMTYGTPDYEAWTIPLTVTAAPKEMTAGLTTAHLVCNGTSYPMTAQENSRFSVTLDLPLLQEADFQQVVFSEGNTQRIETLDRQEVPGAEAIPLFTASLSFTYTPSGKEGVLDDLSLILDTFNQTMDWTQWKELVLIPFTDGREGTPIPLDLDSLDSDTSDRLQLPLDDLSYPVPRGRTLAFSLQATYVSGLRCVTPLVTLSATEDGGLDESASADSATELYSPSGKLLWSGSLDELF